MTAQLPSSVPDELAPGSTLGKYEILRKLATGGMAELYLARARGVAGFEKTVVLKRILPHVAKDELFVQMFLDEARLAATLQHPNIADVYDVGEVDDTPFFAMEYVHGQDVRAIRAAARKRDEQVPIAMALAIAHGTAAALDYAHGRTGPDGRPLELVHRDVSSSNIVVSYDGAIKLLDFGIARAASHRHETQVGTLKGKSPYMSPEQCCAQLLDRRSDLFSLGTVMFELTVGRRPFRGDSDFAIMDQIVHTDAPRPTALIPGYPVELEAIVLRLLARRVEDRYQSAEELLHDLEGFISRHGLWVSSRPLGKYMRLLFAGQIEGPGEGQVDAQVGAWGPAATPGDHAPHGDHAAEPVTTVGERSDPAMPQPAYPRLLRLSQEIPAIGLPTMQIAAVQPLLDEPDTVPGPPSPTLAAGTPAGQPPSFTGLQALGFADARAMDAAGLQALGFADARAMDAADLRAMDAADLRAMDAADLRAMDAADLRAMDAADLRAMDAAPEAVMFGESKPTACERPSSRALVSDAIAPLVAARAAAPIRPVLPSRRGRAVLVVVLVALLLAAAVGAGVLAWPMLSL